MFISEIFASGFRCFGVDNALMLKLRPGLNILVGPNDAGTTAIIDAPRYVLGPEATTSSASTQTISMSTLRVIERRNY